MVGKGLRYLQNSVKRGGSSGSEAYWLILVLHNASIKPLINLVNYLQDQVGM